jgi:putative transposase
MAVRSKLELYLHLVWATKWRADRLTEPWERLAYRCITQEAERLGCVVPALDGMPDHVHLVVRLPSTVSVAQLVKQIKGVSSATVNQNREEFTEPFAWQDGYSCFSISQSHLRVVISYVRRQKERHSQGKVWPLWEETDEPTPPSPRISKPTTDPK